MLLFQIWFWPLGQVALGHSHGCDLELAMVLVSAILYIRIGNAFFGKGAVCFEFQKIDTNLSLRFSCPVYLVCFIVLIDGNCRVPRFQEFSWMSYVRLVHKDYTSFLTCSWRTKSTNRKSINWWRFKYAFRAVPKITTRATRGRESKMFVFNRPKLLQYTTSIKCGWHQCVEMRLDNKEGKVFWVQGGITGLYFVSIRLSIHSGLSVEMLTSQWFATIIERETKNQRGNFTHPVASTLHITNPRNLIWTL